MGCCRDGRPAPGGVHWQAATYSAVHDLLTNPVYAGAFVFGRTRTEKRIDPADRVVSRTLVVARAVGGVDPNWRAPRGFGGGAAREGAALLQGRIRCGKWRMMQIGCSGVQGNWSGILIPVG